MFKIIKRGANNFWHVLNNNAKEVSISDFEVVLDAVANTFVIVFKNGANVPSVAVNVLDIIVIDETDSDTEYTFTNVADLRDKLVILGYTAYLGAGNADSITGLVIAGTNVTITGSGTLADPYVINSSGSGGGIPEAPNNTNAYIRSGLAWVIGYTKTAIDNLLNGKFNNPSGNNTQYLDGAGLPTTFPSIPSAFNPSEHDLEEFLNGSSDPYARQSEVGGSQNIDEVLGVGNTAIDKELILDTADVVNGGKALMTNSGFIFDTYDGQNTLGISALGINVTDPINSKGIRIEKEGLTYNQSTETGSTKVNFASPTTDEVFTIPNETGTGATREWVTANPPTIVVDADDVTETATRVFVTPSEKAAITHSNRSTLDLITEAFTTTLKTAYDNAVSWISTNGTNVLNHLTRTDNPHNVTKSQVGLSNVDNTSDVNKPVSTAQATAIGLKEDSSNKSTSTGDSASTTKFPVWSVVVSYVTGLGYQTASNVNSLITSALASFKTTNFLDFTSSGQTQINSKVDKTSWIDISATSTIVGLSVFTTKQIYYKRIDTNLIQVKGHLSGTSNSPLINFSIPFTSANNIQNLGIAGIVNNGVSQTNLGIAACNPNSNVVNIFRDFNGLAFAGVGTKTGIFSIVIEIQP